MAINGVCCHRFFPTITLKTKKILDYDNSRRDN